MPVCPTSVDNSKGPNRVNRAHWPAKENTQLFCIFPQFFWSMENMASDGRKWEPQCFSPSNPNLADILGRTDLNFENDYLFDFWDPKFLDFQVPKSPNSQMSRSPDFQISRRRRRRRRRRCCLTNSQIPTRSHSIATRVGIHRPRDRCCNQHTNLHLQRPRQESNASMLNHS